MQSIKVHSVTGDVRPVNAISVWDASSTGKRPVDSIPVWDDTNEGDKPLNAIQVKLVGDEPNAIKVWFKDSEEPGPGPQPGPTWDETTIGDTTWAAENLSYDDGGEGILIVPNVIVNGVNFGTQYYYRSDAVMRLYKNWSNLPFNGWHIATQDEGSLLQNHVASNPLSLMTTSGWDDRMNGNNLNGFNGAPLGYYWDNEGVPELEGLGSQCAFWLYANGSEEYSDDFDNFMYFGPIYMSWEGFDAMNFWYPIRLVKDPVDPYNPLGLPPYTIRLKYKQGTTPTFSKGTGTIVDEENNIWDLTYENWNWKQLLYQHSDLLEVLGANTTGVTDITQMLYQCESLTYVALFDTSNVTRTIGAFQNCTSLTTVPLFNPSKVINFSDTFYNCTNVESGAFALYEQASKQTNPPTYHTNTFYNCGSNTQTGAAELAQIPIDWGGTKS